jgi:integrase
MRIEAEARKKVLAGRAWELKLEVKPFNEAAGMYLDWCVGEYRQHPATAKRIKTSFASLKEFFKGAAVSQIRSGDIEDYKSYRRQTGIKEVTVRHDLHALSGFFRYALKHNWARENPVKDVAIPSDKDAVRIHVLTDAEKHLYFSTIKALAGGVGVKAGPFAALNKAKAATQYGALYDAARLILLQGTRPEEVMRARVEDVQGDHWDIRQGKSSAAKRRLKLGAESKAILEARAMVARNGWLFPGKVTGHAATFQRAHDAVVAKCGLGIVMYDLRHTAATRWAAAGMPVTTIAATLGHNNLRTVMKYVHVRQADIDEGMNIVEATRKPKRVEVVQ